MDSNIYFMIFDVSEIDKINFNQVIQTSEYSTRKSIDELKTFVKWENIDIPSSILNLTTKQGPYNYIEMLEILATSEWSPPFPPVN